MIKNKIVDKIKKLLILFLLLILTIEIRKIYFGLYTLIILKRDITQKIT